MSPFADGLKTKAKRIGGALRWLIGLGLLAVLLAKIEWRPLAEVWRHISLVYLAVLMAFSFLLVWISCLKWRLLLGDRGGNVTVGDLMSLYLVGYFFSHFLPSQYGGDVVRGYELGKDINSQTASFGSVFLERYTGFVALVLVSTAAAPLLPDLIGTAAVGLPFLAAWTVLAVSFWLAADQRPVAWLAGRLTKAPADRLGRAAVKLHREFAEALRRPSLMARVMALSVLFHLLAVVNTYLAVITIKAQVEFLPLMVVVPIILIVSTIPITVNSIGLWEGAFVFFLVPLGLTGAQALSVALVLRAKSVVMAFMGGVIYLARRRR